MIPGPHHPLAIRAVDVQRLDDEQLRELLKKLCEAELAAARLPLGGITAGGHQNAPDGGLDLRVEANAAGTSFLPAFPVGVQCKVEPMGPAKIDREMRPSGAPRPVLAELARRGGSYILAAGRDRCSDVKHQKLLSTMTHAIHDLAGAEHLQLRFYDADQLSRWTEHHEGVALWLADQLGLPRHGWRPFGSWSNLDEDVNAPYLSDEALRVRIDGNEVLQTTEQALTHIRNVLAQPQSSVRLVGLSGMGKTRFAQALFDPRLGSGCLSESVVIYGDTAVSDLYSAELMAGYLRRRKQNALLVVDNCPGDLHRRLVEEVRHRSSTLSLLTIDFDVSEDQFAHTTLVRLEPADDPVIDELLQRRAPTVPIGDRDRIVEFSGGNARIALALAINAHGQSLVRLSDAELLGKLFLNTRRARDDDLWRVARATSLVYAFDVAQGAASREAQVLAHIANVDIDTFYEKLSELLERGLAQKRGTQRAILPQALAARIASEALRRTTEGKIEQALTRDAPKRLQKSFTRRLGLLHDVPEAVVIAEHLLESGLPFQQWSSQDRWLALGNLAPLVPGRVLEILCVTLQHADPKDFDFRWFIWDRAGTLLVALAYIRNHFSAATRALIDLTTRLGREARDARFREALVLLFRPFLARTEATTEERFSVLAYLLDTTDEEHRSLGFDALVSTLTLYDHRGTTSADFGSRRQITGWRPRTDDEVTSWFERAFAMTEDLLLGERATLAHRTRLARCFVDLLAFDLLRPRAMKTIRAVGHKRYWAQAWFAACRLIHWHTRVAKELPPSIVDIEIELRPCTADDRFEAWVLADPHDWQQPFAAADDVDSWENYLGHARLLGEEIAAVAATRRSLTARAMREPHAHAFCLGEGLAKATVDLDDGWHELRTTFEAVSSPEPNVSILQGYLQGARRRDAERTAAWLADASGDPHLRPWIVDLHFGSGQLGDAAARHILAALEHGAIDPCRLSILQLGRSTYALPNRLLSRIVIRLCATAKGACVAADVLHMRYHGASEAPLDSSLIRAGRLVLRLYAAGLSDPSRAHAIESIAKLSLPGAGGRSTAEVIARNLLRQRGDDPEMRDVRRRVLSVVLEHHPIAGLNVLFGTRQKPAADEESIGLDDDEEGSHMDARVLRAVDDTSLRAWISESPQEHAAKISRYVAMSAVVDSAARWTPTALWLLSPEVVTDQVIREFDRRFFRGHWSGSAEARHRQLRQLAEHLLSHPDERVAAWAAKLVEGEDARWAQRDRVGPREMASFE